MNKRLPEPIAIPENYPCATFFLDESAARASGGSFFVVGGIKTRKPGQLLRAVRALRDEYDATSEFKFSGITRGRLTAYFKLIDILHDSDSYLIASVIDRNGSNPFGAGEPEWKTHARLGAKLLVGGLNQRELGAALVDSRSTPAEVSFGDTMRSMANHRLKGIGMVSVVCADSCSNDGLQLADLVVGAINHQRRSPSPATLSHKARVASRLAEAFSVSSFADDLRSSRVNIMTVGGEKPLVKAGRSRTGTVVELARPTNQALSS